LLVSDSAEGFRGLGLLLIDLEFPFAKLYHLRFGYKDNSKCQDSTYRIG